MDKPSIAIALEGGPKKKMGALPALSEEADETVESPEEDAADPSMVEAAGALRAALSSSDDAELAKTLKGFIKLCGDYS